MAAPDRDGRPKAMGGWPWLACIVALGVGALQVWTSSAPGSFAARADGPVSTVTAEATVTATPEPTPTPTASPAPNPSATATPAPTAAATLAPAMATPTAEPTAEPSPTPVPQTPTAAHAEPVKAAGASPIADPDEPPPQTATTTATPAVTLRVETADVAFGEVAANGRLDPTVVGVTSAVDEGGAWYVKEGAISVTVTSLAPWTASCRAVDGGGSAIPLDGRRLAWRPAGAADWTPFRTDEPVPPYDNACFPNRPLGTATYVYDLRLWVAANDPPGPFAATVSFVVSP